MRVWLSSWRTDLVSADLDQKVLTLSVRTLNATAFFLRIKTLYLIVVNLKTQHCRDETFVERSRK